MRVFKFKYVFLIKSRIQGSTVIAICVNIAYLLSIVMYPYMPNVACTIRKQLNVSTFDVTNELDISCYDGDNIKPSLNIFFPPQIHSETLKHYL